MLKLETCTTKEYLCLSYLPLNNDVGLHNVHNCLVWQEGEDKTITIDDYVDVESYSEEALMAAVAKQPVSVAIEASAWDFQLYSEV